MSISIARSPTVRSTTKMASSGYHQLRERLSPIFSEDDVQRVVYFRANIDLFLRRITYKNLSLSNHVRYALQDGNRTRPLSVLLSCAAVGGVWQDALPAATAIELAHKASVIRDDLVDGDYVRRGRPTFHARFGMPIAVGVSDWMIATAFGLVEPDLSEPRTIEAARNIIEAYQAASYGQLLDILGRNSCEEKTEDPLSINILKTGRIAGISMRIGAIIGGGSLEIAESLDCFGQKIGTAFQIMNDIRNFQGLEAGRLVASDLLHHKHNLLVAHALRRSRSDCQTRIELIISGEGEMTDESLGELRGLIIQADAVRMAESQANQFLEEAHSYLEVLPESWAKRIMADLTRSNVLKELIFD